MRNVPATLAFCILSGGLLVGCSSDGPERVIVAGTVTYQGKPLEKGQIRFVPVPGSKLPASGAFITDGRYVADAKGGVPVGTHKILIEAYRIDAGGSLPADSPDTSAEATPPRHQYIPGKYNVNTELEITIESGSGRITRDFALTD